MYADTFVSNHYLIQPKTLCCLNHEIIHYLWLLLFCLEKIFVVHNYIYYVYICVQAATPAVGEQTY